MVLVACDAKPVVLVATPIPMDANFRTYRHPMGVFTLRLPPDWSIRDVTEGSAVRVEFSPPNNTGLPMTVYVLNTGNILTASGLLAEIDRYQTVVNGNPGVYTEVLRKAQGDGSWRLDGVRQTPIGTRQLNTFVQSDRTFLAAIEIDLTGLSESQLKTTQTVINTFRLDATVNLSAGQLQAPEAANVATSGVLEFSGIYEWVNPQGVFIINGLVTNRASSPLEAIRVSALLYDTNNNVLAEQPDVVGVEVLYDGESAPFSISFRSGKPTQLIRYELQAAARNAEYALSTHLSEAKFLLGNDTATYNANGFLVVSADVVNSSGAPAYFIKALITIFDPDGRVVAAESVFLTKPDLLPGEASRFDATFYELGGSAGRYDIRIEGKSTQ